MNNKQCKKLRKYANTFDYKQLQEINQNLGLKFIKRKAYKTLKRRFKATPKNLRSQFIQELLS